MCWGFTVLRAFQLMRLLGAVKVKGRHASWGVFTSAGQHSTAQPHTVAQLTPCVGMMQRWPCLASLLLPGVVLGCTGCVGLTPERVNAWALISLCGPVLCPATHPSMRSSQDVRCTAQQYAAGHALPCNSSPTWWSGCDSRSFVCTVSAAQPHPAGYRRDTWQRSAWREDEQCDA